MKKIIKAAAIASLVTGFSATSSVAADTIGFVADISGDVLIKRDGNFLLASNGSGVLSGDLIYAAPGSSAVVSKGECKTSLTDYTEITVGADGSCDSVLMAQVNQPTPAPQQQPLPPTVTLPPAPQANTLLIIGGTVASAAVVAIAVGGGENDSASSP